MVEDCKIKLLKPNERLSDGTVFRFVTHEDAVYGPYFVSGEPFNVGESGEKWNRGFVLEVAEGKLTPTIRDTVIMPGVKIVVYAAQNSGKSKLIFGKESA